MLNQKLSQVSQEDFNFLIKNGVRSSKLLNFDFESVIYFSWGFLKETLPDLFSKNEFEKLFYLMFQERKQSLFLNDIKFIPVSEAMYFILWLIDELKSVNELESKYLRSEPDIKMIQAGINNLDQFGIKNTLDNLAKGDILKYDAIRKLRYHDVFDKQYMEVVKSEIEKKRAKIK